MSNVEERLLATDADASFGDSNGLITNTDVLSCCSRLAVCPGCRIRENPWRGRKFRKSSSGYGYGQPTYLRTCCTAQTRGTGVIR
jgi:hypothetical protein